MIEGKHEDDRRFHWLPLRLQPDWAAKRSLSFHCVLIKIGTKWHTDVWLLSLKFSTWYHWRGYTRNKPSRCPSPGWYLCVPLFGPLPAAAFHSQARWVILSASRRTHLPKAESTSHDMRPLIFLISSHLEERAAASAWFITARETPAELPPPGR